MEKTISRVWWAPSSARGLTGFSCRKIAKDYRAANPD
jgi:hypothetical protein